MEKEDSMYDGSDLYTLLDPIGKRAVYVYKNVVMKLMDLIY